MDPPRIYADFNDLGVEMSLAYNGTLRDLSRQKIRLSDGLVIIVYDDDGEELMEAHAVVRHRPSASSSPRLQWHACVDLDTFRRSPSAGIEHSQFAIPCFTCGADVYRQAIERKISDMAFECAKCGSRVLEPYLAVTPPNFRRTGP